MTRIFQSTRFYSPDIPAGSNLELPRIPATPDDVYDLLKADDVDKPEITDDKTVDKTPPKGDEDKEDEIEIKEPTNDDEKLDLKADEEEKIEEEPELEIEAPPRKQEVTKEYPEFFKKFPWFEKMMFRDKAYTELFGSFEDAKALKEKSAEFDDFENQLFDGNTEEILKAVKSSDETAFNKITDNYLQTLAKVDKEAYFHAVNGVTKKLIIDMYNEGKSTNNQDLQDAAVLINQFLYGTSKFTPHEKLVKEEKPDDAKIQAERERINFLQERFDTARNDLQSSVDNTLRATISDYIDPGNKMSAYVKRNAVSDALKDLHETLGNDKALVANLDKLWRAALDNKFDRQSLEKIKKLYLGVSKRALPASIKKIRTEALKDSTPRDRNRSDEDETPRREIRRERATTASSSGANKNGMKPGESVTDFFARD